MNIADLPKLLDRNGQPIEYACVSGQALTSEMPLKSLFDADEVGVLRKFKVEEKFMQKDSGIW